MGTRGLLGFKFDGKFKGSYNHFDSYPEGLGQEVVDFMRNIVEADQLDTFLNRVRKISWVNEDKKPSKKLQTKYFKFADLGVGNRDVEDWYCLLRNVQGAECLPHILAGTLSHLIDGTEFLEDGLFCEYAYVINFDNNTLEFYDSGEFVKAKPFNRLPRKAKTVYKGRSDYDDGE